MIRPPPYLGDRDVLDLGLGEVELLGQHLVLLLTVAQREHVTVTPRVHLVLVCQGQVVVAATVYAHHEGVGRQLGLQLHRGR